MAASKMSLLRNFQSSFFGGIMQSSSRLLVIANISLSPDASYAEAFSVADKRLKSIGISTSNISYSLFKKSIDARKKEDIKLIYSVACRGEIRHLRDRELQKISASYHTLQVPSVKPGNARLNARPIVVGAGPAGLFAALLLAENGYMPIVIERGGNIDDRVKSQDRLYRNRVLDTSSNIQFGLGGAGTFSDGKLITRTNDALCNFVLSTFVKFGAPLEITYQAKPHIGTDILRTMVTAMAERIEALGGEIRYFTTLKDLRVSCGNVTEVITDKGSIPAGAVILAIGHSARDTHETLFKQGFSVEAKNFSVGMRIEHLAEDIDRSMLGKFAGKPSLGHAEYALSCNTKVRGAYTFWMCPGGEVVCACSEEGGLVVNGMSYSDRGGRNSNSALVVSVFKEDFGADPLSAIEFQRNIERRAFVAGGGDYSAPIITVGDFLSGRLGSEPSRILPTYMAGGVRLAKPSDYLPDFVSEGIRGAILNFENKIKGFSCPDAILTGAETRTSSPVRILRDAKAHRALGVANLFPCGEGAGYAGGITSAAIDGIRCAMSLIETYKPLA